MRNDNGFSYLIDKKLWGVPTLLSVFLIIIAQYNFLVFHTLAEFFAIVISFIIFAFAWSTHRFSKNSFLLFLASGYFWIGSLDMVHTLVYKGVNIIGADDGNMSIQFWIGTRYLEAILLLVAPLPFLRKQNQNISFILFGFGALSLFTLIWAGIFPVSYVDGIGLTTFKVNSEYIIDVILAFSIFFLLKFGRDIPRTEKELIVVSIFFTMCAEIAFTFYVDVYGLSNLVGHILKLFSFWFILQAVVISNLKQPFLKLESLKNYNRNLFETSPLGLALCRMDGSLVDVNQAYANILGHTIEDSKNLSYWQITPEKYAEQEQQQLDELNTIGKYGPYIKEYLHKDGQLIPVQLSGRLIELNGEQFIWSSVEDISERVKSELELKKATKELSEHRDHLQELVDERTVALKQISEEAEAANQAKSSFLSSMSHELRTPLNAVLGFAQLLETNKKEKLSRNQKSYVRQIIDGGEHLLKLINEVLDLAKIEAGKITYSLEVVPSKEVIEECKNVVSSIAMPKGVRVVDNTDINLPSVWVDRLRCKQAILNLTSNAVKYNKNGGQIYFESSLLADDFLRFIIRDTGEGIPLEKQKLLFQPFQRLGAENSEVEGTGVGLVLTKKFVEEMNGRIGFTSEEGRGSSFWVDFPIANEENGEDNKTENSALEQLRMQDTKLLLYIEDNPSSVALMEGIVENIPRLEQINAHNAELGISLAEKHQPDLILLDINLPGMNGLEAVEVLKRNINTTAIPVFALSANAMPEYIDMGMQSGFEGYLTKPLKISDLYSVFQDTLNINEEKIHTESSISNNNNWSDNYLIGFKPIDEDHQKLLNLLDRLSEDDISQDEGKDILDELLEYTKYHFAREEKVMQVCAYPDFVEHQELHADFIRKIINLQKLYKTTPLHEVQNECRSILREWFVNHIMVIDKGISSYIQGKEADIMGELNRN